MAGKPSIKASKITPSIPIKRAKGSKNEEQCVKMVVPPIEIFAISHIMSPVGAAITIALPRTKRVRSNIERTITFPTCGRLYGGSSSVKEEGTPFNNVLDKNLDDINVSVTPRIIITVNKTVDRKEEDNPTVMPVKNMVIIAIRVGNLPPSAGEIQRGCPGFCLF